MASSYAHRLTELAAETRIAAGQLDHEWDRRAIDWPLDRDSVVVEVGGFKGRWALQIAELYNPHLYVFEPQPWAAAVCREALGERARVLEYALGVEGDDEHPVTVAMGEWETDGCSIIKPGHNHVTMHAIERVFAFLGLTHIDLMLMNIEGYEYTLLPYMLEQGIAPCRLMVQFHTFADPSGMRLAKIYEQLEQAHYSVAWTYDVTLTAWDRGC